VEFAHAFDYPGCLLWHESDYCVGGEGGPVEVGLGCIGG